MRSFVLFSFDLFDKAYIFFSFFLLVRFAVDQRVVARSLPYAGVMDECPIDW